jgi:hypothetical protein
MNYATALELPTSWATDAQRYGSKAIRYTSFVFKAFNQEIAPVLGEAFKDQSHYYFQCLKGVNRWAMKTAGITHNPVTASISAALAELTSTEAQTTYRRLQHIATESAMDALVIGLCGVVAVAQGVEAAQKVYRMVKRAYDWVDGRLNPAQPEPSILPTVTQFFAQDKAEEDIAALIEAVGHERSFLKQLDRLDADALTTVQAKADEAIAGAIQAKANQCKCDRAAMVLRMEGDRISREALAYVIDRAVAYATAETVPIAEASALNEDSPTTVQQMLQATAAPAVAEAELVGALDVPGATGKRRGRAKASTSKAGVKPKGARVKAKV